ncbi:MAG: 4-hydroxy-tetrahydrodipicolinate synthase [Myxococcaceae bacterium]
MGLVYTALVTPFKSDNSLDIPVFEALLDKQLEAGIHGVVVCGSTGEAITLSDPEKEMLLKSAVKRVAGKIPILMGAGHANTQVACLWQQKAQDLGATYTLHVTPWYNKATPEGLYAHYEAIANTNPLPIIIYNVPTRTSCNIPVDVVLKLAQNFKSIKGLKECNFEPFRLNNLFQNAPTGFEFFSGEDAFILPWLAMGGHGVISVWSNLKPELLVQLLRKPTLDLAQKLGELSAVWPSRPNPIPIKTAMELNQFRLPLLALEPKEREELLTSIDRIIF